MQYLVYVQALAMVLKYGRMIRNGLSFEEAVGQAVEELAPTLGLAEFKNEDFKVLVPAIMGLINEFVELRRGPSSL